MTWDFVEPTPTPLAVCSSGDVVLTFVTRSPLWNVTVTRLYTFSTKVPNSFEPTRTRIGRPSFARTCAFVICSFTPPMLRCTTITARADDAVSASASTAATTRARPTDGNVTKRP